MAILVECPDCRRAVYEQERRQRGATCCNGSLTYCTERGSGKLEPYENARANAGYLG
jgi:hypothetical protein